MKQIVQIAMTGLLAMASLLGTVAYAHTALKESLPAHGAVVTASPTELKLIFTAPVSLVKVEILHMGQHAMETGFKPVPQPQSEFLIAMPMLSPASYTVNWAVIGADGHTVADTLSFVVDPNAPATDAAPHAHGEEHEHEAGHDHAAAHAEHGDH